LDNHQEWKNVLIATSWGSYRNSRSWNGNHGIAEINFFQRKTPTSIGGEMNAGLSRSSGYTNISWNRGTQSKNATSCGNDWVTNFVLLLSLRFRTDKNTLLTLR